MSCTTKVYATPKLEPWLLSSAPVAIEYETSQSQKLLITSKKLNELQNTPKTLKSNKNNPASSTFILHKSNIDKKPETYPKGKREEDRSVFPSVENCNKETTKIIWTICYKSEGSKTACYLHRGYGIRLIRLE